MLKAPFGIILVTGPTGSGKTTTLHAKIGEVVKNADYEKIEALADIIVEDMNKEHHIKEEAPVRKWRCKICGYEYSGEELPENFICPLCKHPASDFEEITE